MRTLTLFEDTPILTLNGLVKAADSASQPMIDGFGREIKVVGVEKAGEARAVLLQMKDHGDPFVVPENAMVKPRTPEDGTYKAVAAADLSINDHFFLLPNRKIRLLGTETDREMPALPAELADVVNSNSADQLVWLLQFLEHAEANDPEHQLRGLVLKFEDIFQARLGGELLSLYGVKIARHRSRPWVYPDQRRPSCVVAKLLSGVLHGEARDEVLYEFYGKGILRPSHPLDDELLGRCAAHGVLLEGQAVENLVRVHHVKRSERKRPTVVLTLSHNAPIESVWVQL